MFDNYGEDKDNKKKIIIEIRTLVNEEEADDYEEDLDEYCNFMKQMMLDTSSLN